MPTWEEVARSHGRFIYTVAYRLTGNHDEAQDLVQEVLLRVRRGLASYRPGSMEAWLSRITTNAFLDEVRRKKRRPLEVVPDLPERVTGVDQEPLDVLDTSRLPEHIQEALEVAADRVPQCRRALRRGRAELPGDRRVARRPGRHRPQPHPPRPRPAEGDARMTTLPPPDSFELLSAYLDGELTRGRARPGRRPPLPQPRAPRRAGSGRAGPHLGASAAAWSSRPMASSNGRSPPVAQPPAPAKKHKWGMLNLVATAAVWVLVLGFVNMSRSHDVSPDAATLAQTHTEASAGFGGLLGSLGDRPARASRPHRRWTSASPTGRRLSLPGDAHAAPGADQRRPGRPRVLQRLRPRDALRAAGQARPVGDRRSP